ncbi:MAG: hypothetical protein WEB30_08570 [Cyclobacteriaceae bacterium]
MRNTSTRFILRLLTNLATGCLLMFSSCREDGNEISPSIIQFSVNVQKVSEGDEVIITLTLDKPAPGSGSVELSLEGNAVYNQHYVTAPAPSAGAIVLRVYKGHTSTAVKIEPVDNAKFEGSKFLILQLSNPAGGLRLGEITALTVVMADDEGPSLAGFAVPSGTVNEQNENGIVVDIPFSAPAKGEGSLTVTLQQGQAVLGRNFTIDQEQTNNSFSFNVGKNSAGVSFKVFPVDNDLFTGNFILQFAITDISGVVQKGDNQSYTLTVADDEAPSVAKFGQSSGAIDESNADGISVEILLSSPVKGEGTIGIALAAQNSIYGTDFTTVPELKDNSIILNLSHNQHSASFTVFPVNDDLLTGEQILLFSIDEASGVVWKGSDSATYELTIVDDEGP